MLIAVGGSASHCGKTTLACALIQALPGRNWAFVKLTPHRHVNPAAAFALAEDAAPGPSSTGRALAAGAARAFLLQAPPESAAEARAALAQLHLRHPNLIVESSRAPDVLPGALFLMVLNGAPLKPSAQASLLRAHAVVGMGTDPAPLPLPPVPCFLIPPDGYLPEDFLGFLLAWAPAAS